MVQPRADQHKSRVPITRALTIQPLNRIAGLDAYSLLIAAQEVRVLGRYIKWMLI